MYEFNNITHKHKEMFRKNMDNLKEIMPFYNIDDFSKGMKEVNNKEFNFNDISWQNQTGKLMNFVGTVVAEKIRDEKRR